MAGSEFEWGKVRDFAKARKLDPQHVYYYIRNGRITQQPCPCCGSTVINLKEAADLFDALLAKAQAKRNALQ